MKTFLSIATVAVIMLFGAMILGIGMAPKNPQEELAQDTERCVRAKGNGQWFGSMGVSLADYCRYVSMASMLSDDRKEHPENY